MSDEANNIRAFLAIEPAEDILQAVSRLQEKIKLEVSGRMSWTKPQGQHLTLKFFGDVSADDIKNICSAVEKRLATASSLILKIEKLGVFPDIKRPRVLWLGMNGDVEKLAVLQSNLEKDFEKIDFPREDRPFKAHLTLARIKDPRDINGMSEALKKHSGFKAGEFTCKELILFQSNLTPQGAIYTKLAGFAFGG